MAVVRCSRCGKAFERTPHQVQVCPNCGLRAPLVEPGQEIIPDTLVGRPRRALVVLLLAFLVQAVFWPWFLIATFRPLDRQHGRTHPIGWWVPSVLPVAGLLLGLPYAGIGLARLHRSRRARGLRRGIGPFWFTVTTLAGPLAALGALAYFVGSKDGAAFNVANLTDGSVYRDVLGNLAAWKWLAVSLPFALTPALALSLAAASANRLWRAIYTEKGEAWPWRGAPAVPAA